MKILAIDPGYGRCGVAVLSGSASSPSLLFSACIETSKDEAPEARLRTVGSEIARLLDLHRPEMVAIEEVFFSKNQKTALSVAEARGAIKYVAAAGGYPVLEFNPSAVKIALTGEGRAEKSQVTAMVRRILRLDDTRRLDDEYDAIALGITALAEGSVRAHG